MTKSQSLSQSATVFDRLTDNGSFPTLDLSISRIRLCGRHIHRRQVYLTALGSAFAHGPGRLSPSLASFRILHHYKDRSVVAYTRSGATRRDAAEYQACAA